MPSIASSVSAVLCVSALLVALLPVSMPAEAGDLIVMTSGGTAATLKALAPDIERRGWHLRIVRGPSMGDTHDAIPARLARGERCDAVMMVGRALDALHEAGSVDAGTVLAGSRIGVVVKAGAPHPVIDTPEALRRALLAAPSVVYSDSASGVYVSHVLFRRLGIETQMQQTSHMMPATPVAQVVAEGGAAIGFQQISEILPVPGAELIGPIPDALQEVTPYSVALCRSPPDPQGAAEFLRLLTSSRARDVMRAAGLDPVVPAGR